MLVTMLRESSNRGSSLDLSFLFLMDLNGKGDFTKKNAEKGRIPYKRICKVLDLPINDVNTMRLIKIRNILDSFVLIAW